MNLYERAFLAIELSVSSCDTSIEEMEDKMCVVIVEFS